MNTIIIYIENVLFLCWEVFFFLSLISSHGIFINDNLTVNLNHKIRFRLNFLEIICTKLMLIVLMLDYQVE